MSTFTLPLKRVIELTGGTTELVNGVTKVTGGNIGLDYYPLYDNTYRDILNGKIVDHYWNREIGMETIDMFQLAMRRRMNEIMPAYNKLYETLKIEFDPLSTIDMRTVSVQDTIQNTNSSGNATSDSDTNSQSRTVTSETPQTMLSGDGDYATGAADSRTDSTGHAANEETNTASIDANANSSTDITGYQGLASDLIMRYRESIINVDRMIINELNDLFMLIWDTADEYMTHRGILQ